MNLLEFFISRFDNVKQAFVKIDGVGGNGQITFRELLDGLEDASPEGGGRRRTSGRPCCVGRWSRLRYTGNYVACPPGYAQERGVG